MNKITKKKRLLFAPVLALVLFLIISCNDEPTSLSSSLLLDTIAIKSISSKDTNLIIDSKSFLYRLEIFNSGAMFIGKSNDLIAVSMIRFSGIPNTLDRLTESDIDSVTLHLPLLKYAFGDITDQRALSFKIYKITKLWTNTSNWDTIFSSGNQSDYFDYTKVLGTFDSTINQSDTVFSPLTIQLDKQLIIEWFKLMSDTLTAGNIYGIALVPDDNSKVIRSFSANTLQDARVHPYIKVKYRRTADTLDTLIISSAIDASVTNSNKPDEKSLTIQGAVSSRFKINFDVSGIPDEAAVHIAELEMYFDKSNSVSGNYGFDTVLLARLYSDSTYTSYLGDYYASRIDEKTGLYKFAAITSAIQYWITHGKKGELVFLPQGIDNEYREFDRMVFYGLNEPDSTKRPVLRIIYSTRPKTGCKP
jgi:hypothetical protein